MSRLADQIAEALRASMSRPSYGYIDFTYDDEPGSLGDRELVALAEDIASFMPDSLDAA